ncbi:MAG: Rrf2 family transcriptional regulator [Oscillospiraceae bacterium]|nr:Rrf2 family transcriptional regulator [Oscillospiraceae bacterium]
MKISAKVECGIMVLVDICVHSEGDSVTVSNIAARQNLSAKYLEQILPLLKHAHIIRSIKGSRGGYYLARPAKEITMQQVIDALDSTVLSGAEFESISETLLSTAICECIWDRMSEALCEIAGNLTLADVAAAYTRLVEESTPHLMYYI